jgi:polyisoprenoid-binding protein YceI
MTTARLSCGGLPGVVFMRALTFVLAGLAAAAATIALPVAGTRALASSPLTVSSARVSLDGTSNLNTFTASTHTVMIRAIELAGAPVGDVLDYVLQPGSLKGLEVTIPTRSLTSPKEGIDKNMHKALKAEEHPNLRFHLTALEGSGTSYRATGLLTAAGVEKEVALALQVRRADAVLVITGTTDLSMTDFGITPPTARLGMLKTNPQVKIRIELQLRGPLV